MEDTHRTIGGAGAGRRWQVQHLNDSYILYLAAHFQLFCRNLHSEAVTFFVSEMPTSAQTPIQVLLLRDRQLDRVNAQPGSLGADFGRLGMSLWDRLKALSNLNSDRQSKLEQLNVWRNSIAHQNLPPASQSERTLQRVRSWRSACNGLAKGMDEVVAQHVLALLGKPPW